MKSVERKVRIIERRGSLLSANRYQLIAILLSLPLIFAFNTALEASGQPIENLFPDRGFSEGWAMEGGIKRYTAENLYVYINGEAELYMPYGFEVLGTALYTKHGSPEVALTADVYRMGSLLDAFGIYAYYRDPDADDARTGSEGFIDESQVMFYKDRYFVRISASGSGNPGRAVLAACAKAFAAMIPGESMRPEELGILKARDIVPRTEKYIAQSVMGYVFFRKGLTAEANLDGGVVKVFVVFNDSEEASGYAIDSYLKYLKEKGMSWESGKVSGAATIIARDPLYKGVMVRRHGRYLIGVAGLPDPPTKATPLIERLQPLIVRP